MTRRPLDRDPDAWRACVQCGRTAVHRHHRLLRRHCNEWQLTDPDCLAHVCQPCHLLIHANPDWARRHGLLVHSWQDYRPIPIHPGCPVSCETDHRPPEHREVAA